MPTSNRLLLPLVLGLALITSGCAGAAAPGSPSASAAASQPAASVAPSAAASVAGPTTPEDAAALVVAQEPLFAGFGPKDADAIGQCCWHEVTQTSDGYRVLVHAGWGDCPSGCIENHEWIFDVSSSGEVSLVNESGDPVPPDGIPDGPA
jgi:hypothetical protein